MAGPADDIYQFDDHPTLPATKKPAPRPGKPSPLMIYLHRIDAPNLLVWILVAVFIGGMTFWAWRAGMKMRDQLWRSTRTIRFEEDIASGFHYGNEVLRQAEREAKLPPYYDARAAKNPADSPDFHRLTRWEIVQGLVKYYDQMQEEHRFGRFGLDYPPMRLAVFTWFVRNVQEANPRITSFPTRTRQPEELITEPKFRFGGKNIVHDTEAPQIEDFTRPMLIGNAVADGVAAVGMFFLVWLWIARGAKRTKTWRGNILEASGGPSSRKNKFYPNGILVFVLATMGFWYALTHLASMPPRPTPIVDVLKVAPSIPPAAGRSAKATPISSASIHGTINSQLMPTKYRVDWGTDRAYGNSSKISDLGAFERPVTIQVTIDKLPPGQVIHYQLVASNAGGVTKSNDEDFVVGGKPVELSSRPVGGTIWPDWSVWFRVVLIFVAMIVSARVLPAKHRGWACGLVAGLLVWFNPIVLIDGHVWPQWDAWILPFIVLAMLFASLELWELAGAMIGIGCLFKGQLLLGAPVLLLWPLLSGRIGAAFRFIGGTAVASGLFLSPFILQSAAPWKWIISVMVAAGIVATVVFVREYIWRKQKPSRPPNADDLKTQPFVEAVRGPIKPGKKPRKQINWNGVIITASTSVGAAIIAAVLIFRPSIPSLSFFQTVMFLLFFAAVVIPPWFLKYRSLAGWGIVILGAAIWIAAFAYDGDFSWYHLGYEYGSIKQDKIAMGQDSFTNLPVLLERRFGWTLHEPAARFRFTIKSIILPAYAPASKLKFSFEHTRIDWKYDLELRSVLLVIYAATVLLCGIAAAYHSRRKDPRLLVALIAPWIIFPMVLGQMSERYLLWGSALSACCIAVSSGLMLLHVLLAIIGAGMMLHQLLWQDPTRWPRLYELFTPLYPDAGWMMILIAAIFLWAALVPSRKKVAELPTIESATRA